MRSKDPHPQEPHTLEGELREDLEPLETFELPPDIEERVAVASLSAQATASPRWRWLVAAVCLSPLALVLYLASGTSPRSPAPPPSEDEPETFVIRNDGNLILLEQGDQVVSLIGAEQ